MLTSDARRSFTFEVLGEFLKVKKSPCKVLSYHPFRRRALSESPPIALYKPLLHPQLQLCTSIHARPRHSLSLRSLRSHNFRCVSLINNSKHMVIKSCTVKGKQQFYTTAVYTRVKGIKVLVSPGYVADSVDELAYLTYANKALAVRRSALIRKMMVV